MCKYCHKDHAPLTHSNGDTFCAECAQFLADFLQCAVAGIVPRLDMKIKPNPQCKACRGTGEIHQREEFWGAPCMNDLLCDCVIEQIPDGTPDDEEIEIEQNGGAA